MSTYQFDFPMFLTCYHFLLTLVVLKIMGSLRFFEFTLAVPASSRWSMGFFGVIFIVAMHFNLKFNSVGLYRLSQLCTIPCMIIYKLFGQSQKTPSTTLFSLGVLLIGLCLFTVDDVQFDLYGSIIALISVVTTTIYRTQTAILQCIHAVTGIQLNHAVSLPRFVIALITSISIESYGNHNILNYEFHPGEVGLLLATGFFAVIGICVDFSLIGRAGPITFQVVEHVKTMAVFIFQSLVFPRAQDRHEKKIKTIGGLCISMIGAILYTVFEIRNRALLEMNTGEENVAPVPLVETVVSGDAVPVEQA
jgi:solute carrier family 35 protein E3